MERLYWSKSSSGLCWQFFSLRCLSSMFRRRDALSPFVLFVILVQAYWPINLIKLQATCSRLPSPLMNSSNSPVIHFLSIIVFSFEATRLIANRNPSLYDSLIFNLFNSLSVICGKSFLNIWSELTAFLLFDFFTFFS